MPIDPLLHNVHCTCTCIRNVVLLSRERCLPRMLEEVMILYCVCVCVTEVLSSKWSEYLVNYYILLDI